jgi:hypothetical protein
MTIDFSVSLEIFKKGNAHLPKDANLVLFTGKNTHFYAYVRILIIMFNFTSSKKNIIL